MRTLVLSRFLRCPALWVLWSVLAVLAADSPVVVAADNRVIVFNGKSPVLELPSKLLAGSDGELTIEGWFRWDRFAGFGPAISYGIPWHMIGINNLDTTPTLQFFIYGEPRVSQTIQVPNILKLHEWYHLAAVAGTNGMYLYLNGVLVGQHRYTGGIRTLPKDGRMLLGKSLWNGAPDMTGQVDRLRFWRRELSGADVRRLMGTVSAAGENGLLAEYVFDSGTAQDTGPSGHHGSLSGGAVLAVSEVPARELVRIPSRLMGHVYDESGQSLAGAILKLHTGLEDPIETRSDPTGAYQFVWFAAAVPPELSAVSGDLGLWESNLNSEPGQVTKRDLILRRAVNLTGRVQTWDGDPLPDKLVQVLRADVSPEQSRVEAAVRTDDAGRYHFVNLREGDYRVRCLAQGRLVYHSSGTNDASSAATASIVRVDSKGAGEPIDFRIGGGQSGHWSTFDFMDGLPGDNVLCMAQDRDGYLWIGMEYSGAARFDGKEFISLTTADGLPDNKVNVIHHEPSGAIWFGTTRGLARYFEGAWQIWNETNGLPDNYVECILPGTADELWIGTRGGLVRWNSGRLTVWTSRDGLAGDRVETLARDRLGSLWIGTTSGASRMKGGQFETFTTGDGLAANHVRSIVEAEDGSIWFGTWSRGISVLNGTRFTSMTINEGLVDNEIRQIICAADGVLWIATKSGVTRYENGALAGFQSSDGLVAGEIWTAYQSTDGQLWFGSRGGGISRYDGDTLRFLNAQDGLASDSIQALVRQPGGPLWIGTSKGVTRFDGRQAQSFTTHNGLISDDVRALATSSNTVWLGTPNGIARWENGRWSRPDRFPALSGRPVRSIAASPEGFAWFAVYGGGVFQFDGAELRRTDIGSESGGGFTTALFRDPANNLWVGSRELTKVGADDGRHFTTLDGLNAAEIKGLSVDPAGHPWVGTRKGLLHWNGEKFVPPAAADYLANHSVHSIRLSPEKRIWCATAAGVSIYDGISSSLLDTRDGLSANDVRDIWCDDDGTVWFGTANGLNRYQPRRTPPVAAIRGVRSARTYSDLSQLPEFTTGSALAIDFTSIDFRTHPDKRRYRCAIDWVGEEKDVAKAETGAHTWQVFRSGSTFDWAPGKPGWYRFAVQAIDRDLNYSNPVVLLLHVVTPWYANPWITAPMLTAIGLLAIVAVFSTWRYWIKMRESQLARIRMQAQETFSHEVVNRQEEERKRIAAELHDSLGQSLLVMKSRALVALQKPDNPSDLVAQLTEISDTASQAIAETRQIAFNLRPHQLDSLGLHKGIVAMANQVCRAASLELKTDIDNVTGLVAPESQIHLFRIAQEALNNVVKHAGASAVHIELKATSEFLILRIEDNGRGMHTGAAARSAARKDQGHGTNNLTERARYLGGRLDITTGAGGGTAVTVTVPRHHEESPPES